MGSRPTGHIPFSARAKEALAHAVREAQAPHGDDIGTEHLALGLLAVDGGLVRPVLAALGTSAPVLRTAILDRYRQAD